MKAFTKDGMESLNLSANERRAIERIRQLKPQPNEPTERIYGRDPDKAKSQSSDEEVPDPPVFIRPEG